MPKAKYSSIVAETDAVELVVALIERQLEAAERAGTEPNTSMPGDSEARSAFNAVLGLATQRTVFLQHVRNRRFWPRVRSLIGVPPYAFLKPEDDDVLNASGIARNRTHMATRSPILSSSDIGVGHFEDQANRAYRLVADDQLLSKQIHVRRARGASKLVLDVRVGARLSAQERAEIVKSRDPKSLRAMLFPRVGERLALTCHDDFGIDGVLSLVVRTVQAKGPKSLVCRVYCVAG
jgi:hypothetical protein